MEAAAAVHVTPFLQTLSFTPRNYYFRRHFRRRSTITMGIKGLTKLLSEHAPGCIRELQLSSFSEHKIAIDASMSIYQFLVVVGRTGANVLTNEAGEVTSHLQGMFMRTIRLLEVGIKPVYVFDGEPPDLKKAELYKRVSKRHDAEAVLVSLLENGDRSNLEKYSKRTVKVTKKHNEGCRRLLQLMGVPAVQAPSEAEAECAALCKCGKVYGVSSEDMDSLTFGAPKFLRHMMEPASRKIPIIEFDILQVLKHLELSMDQFIDLCILCGCDYCETIKGIGPQTALKLLRKHGSIERILENLNNDRYQIPNPWPFQEARMIFKNPIVTSPDNLPELKWMPPDEEGLRKFLVDENSFNYDRVNKAIKKINNTKAQLRQF